MNIIQYTNITELTSGSSFPVREMSQLENATSTILFTVSCVSSPLISAASPSPIVWRMVWVEWRMWVSIVVSSVREIPSSSFRLNTRNRSMHRSWKEPWRTIARPHTNSSKLILPFYIMNNMVMRWKRNVVIMLWNVIFKAIDVVRENSRLGDHI